MFEINELYKNWRNSDAKDMKEQMDLLKVMSTFVWILM